jgi:hypothetical protein
MQMRQRKIRVQGDCSFELLQRAFQIAAPGSRQRPPTRDIELDRVWIRRGDCGFRAPSFCAFGGDLGDEAKAAPLHGDDKSVIGRGFTERAPDDRNALAQTVFLDVDSIGRETKAPIVPR